MERMKSVTILEEKTLSLEMRHMFELTDPYSKVPTKATPTNINRIMLTGAPHCTPTYMLGQLAKM